MRMIRKTAARLYKYPYREQLMIFAQRPEATACAEYDLWNRTMRRYVRRGSKGIALVDTSGEIPRIRYVFDVADTGARHDSRSPFLWQLEDQHMNAVHDALEQRFGADDFMMADQLEHIASQLAMTYWEENKRDILDIVDGSFLEEYDEFNVGASFRSAAAISISYALLARCGLEPEERYIHEDFLSVFDWNTPDAANALGTAVSQISEQVLRQIEITIKNYERSVEHERDSVSAERGLSDPGDLPGQPAPAAPGQVRQDAEEVPSGASSDPVQPSRPERPASASPAGDRGNGQQQAGADDAGNGGEERSDGRTESEGSNGLGGPDEQPQKPSGRTDPDGTDLRIDETVKQISLFPSETEQREFIETLPTVSAEREKPSALILSDDEINHALRHGSGFEGSKLRIAAFYASHPSPKAAQDFLKEEYGIGGHSHTYLSGNGGFVDYNSKGIRFSGKGYSEQTRMRWPAVEQHIRGMVENGTYLTESEQSRYEEMMRGMAGGEIPVPLPRYHYPPVKAETVLVESTLDLPAPREVNRGDIEAAIQEWNDSLQSKITVARYFREGHSTEETAAFLKQEYGDDLPSFPVTVESAAADISWTQVLEIAREMVREDRFFTDDEREEVQRLSREAETSNPTISATQDSPVFSTQPRGKNPPSQEEMPANEPPVYKTPGGHLYRAGDEIEWRTGASNTQHIRINRIDGDNVYITFPDKLPLINTSLNRQSVELQIDTGHFFVLEKAGNQDAPLLSDVTEKRDSFVPNYGQTVFLPLSADSFREYTNLKRQYPDTIIGFELNGYFEFYGEDAQKVAEICDAALLEKNTPAGQTAATGFSVPRWQSELRRIWSKGNDVYLAGENADGTHGEIKHVYGRDYLPLHAVVHIENRTYSIYQVDFQKDAVTLRDITGTTDSRFPPIRQETTGMVRSYLEEEPDYPLSEETERKNAAHHPDLTEQAAPEESAASENMEEASSGMMETVVELTDQGYQATVTRPVREYQYDCAYHDIAYLDGQVYQVESIGIFDVRFQPLETEQVYPVARVESMERLETLLAQDERNHHLLRSSSLEDRRQAREDWEKRQSPQSAQPQPEQAPAQNFHITDDHLGEGGQKTKYANNVAAIRTLKAIEAENRHATPEEQEILSRYVGWGGIPQAFDPSNASWDSEFTELAGLLTDEEYELARASTLNAHYTSPTVIKAMYQALEQMGFRTGNILEPSCGVGNFFGLLPDSMQNSMLYGVELDSITGRIAQQLYPQAQISVTGFEKTDRRDFFDVAVGNVPFGSYKLADKRFDKHNFLIHDYFFAKALDQVRPGGVIAFITSKGTMDKQSDEVRKYIAQRAELLGAIRLPNNAFKANAGTEVTSDIIFLQKREQPLDIEPEWVHLGQTEDGIPVNSYFADHPEMVLGKMAWDDSMYGNQKETACLPLEGADLSQQLAQAVQRITGEYHAVEAPDLEEGEKIQESIPATPDVKNYSYTVVDDKVYYRENSIMVRPELNAAAQERVKGMVAIRDCVHQLMDAQLEDYGDDAIHALQGELNRLYDDYTAKYGLISSRANFLAFRNDSSYYLLCSLEILDEEGNLARKADMFTKRTIRQQRAIDHVDTAVEALAVSIAEKARVDVPYMAELTYKTEEEIATELTGVIFRLPAPVDDKGKPRYVTADEYLSGNVRQKLREARAAADVSPVFVPNVQALEKAQPKDLEASEIDVRLGATWVGKEYVQQFMEELFEIPLYQRRAVQVQFSEYTSEWHITNKNALSYNNVPVNLTYGTDRANGLRILEDSLNLRDVRIYDIIEDADGKEKRVLNQRETTLAQQKQQAIKDAFREWIWKDARRRETLVTRYNELFNSIRPREYDGQHITFSGMNPEISLREHQRNAIAHILYGGNTLLAHVVGAGKSFEMAGAAMESKRLGLCQKSMFVVPNHLTEQWAAEFLRLYPSAKILVTTKRDFEKSNRKKFCARIATGDYDAVIIGHSQFERIGVSKARQERLLQDQIDELTKGIQELKMTRGEQFSIKQLERTKKQLEGRLRKLQAEEKKDDVVTFEELGVDRLFVDEAHSYKNMFLLTKMRNVAGLSTSEAQKSTDMFLKCRYMDEITGGRGVVFATGTPVSNSMTELYTMQRYLQYDTLRRNNMTHFDCWASTFGETVTAIELAPEGTGYRARTRFAKFFNLPELMTMFKEVADIKTADQLNLPTPEVQFETVVAQPTEHQKAMIQELSRRASAIHAGIDPRKDNMLKVTSDGRKLGLDQRMINPLLPDDPGSKVNQCVNNVFRIWQEGTADRLTQLIFCDISTPKGASGKAAEQQPKEEAAPEKPSQHETDDDFGDLPLDEDEPQGNSLFSAARNNDFSVYEDIRDKLIARGVPREEIAFIHDADTEVKKKELFAKVRSGQVRVLLGSTAKMGAGTNVQDRLIASHDLDCPWRPGDLEQRAGRIVRQGNMNPKVHIYRYVTEGSFDSYLWQTVENKQKFISQIMTSKSPVRSCEDVDETALSYAEIKALCAGDDRIKEKMALDVDVARLRLMKSEHQSNQYRLEDKLLKQFPHDIEQSRGFLLGLQKDQDTLAAHPLPEKDFVGVTILGKDYSDKEKAGEAILEACKSAKMDKEFGIGMYRGFLMYLTYNPLGNQFILSLKGEMTHPVELGPNAVGNFTRIENALAAITKRMAALEDKLESLNQQMATARAELGKPFPQEAELKEKSARLAELDASLNMDNARHGPEAEETKAAPKRNREEAR